MVIIAMEARFIKRVCVLCDSNFIIYRSLLRDSCCNTTLMLLADVPIHFEDVPPIISDEYNQAQNIWFRQKITAFSVIIQSFRLRMLNKRNFLLLKKVRLRFIEILIMNALITWKLESADFKFKTFYFIILVF